MRSSRVRPRRSLNSTSMAKEASEGSVMAVPMLIEAETLLTKVKLLVRGTLAVTVVLLDL